MMRLPALIALFALLATAPARADDTVATSGGPLVIHPVHHAALMLSWNGKHVLADPAPLGREADPAAVYRALPAPDVILITHIHGDHFNVPILEAIAGAHTVLVVPHNVYDALPADLKAKARALANGARATVDGIPLETVPMENTTPARMKFHPPGAGNGYVLTFGSTRVYIAGDTEEVPALAHLANIDVAFVPMNLPFTETVEAAAKWVKDFRPKVVYPYHYRNADGTYSDLAKFRSLVGGASEVRIRDWY